MRRPEAAVALVATAVVLLCTALIFEAGRRIYHSIGPSKAVAAADGSLFVLSHGQIHVFAPDGKRSRAIPLQSLGLTRTPSELALHRDGRVVLADPDTSVLHRCRLPHGPCERLDLGLHRVDMQQLVPLNSVKVAVDDERERYYVSDNAGHAIVIADFAGRVLARSGNYAVRHPNHLFVAAPGELTVVDTDQHRLVTFDVRYDKVGAVLRSMRADRSRVTRPRRRWPFDAVQVPGGETAVLIADDGMKDADLVIFDAAGEPARRVDLGDSSDPFDIELWQGRLVVADATNYRLTAFTLEGLPATGFPPADFATELDAARQVPETWRALRQAARVAMVLVPLAAIAVLWALGRAAPPPAQPSGAAIPLPASSEHVFRYDAAHLRRVNRWLVVIGALVAAALVIHMVLIARLVPGLLHSPYGRVRLVWIAAAWIAIPITFSALVRVTRRVAAGIAIEVTAEGLRVALPGSAGSTVTFEAPWSRVYSDGRRVLAGAMMVRARGLASSSLVGGTTLEHIVLERIPAANRMGGFALGLRAARAGNLFFVFAFTVLFMLLTYLVLGPGTQL